MKKIITVSRQFGSGGRSIARRIAEELGYDYYDSELTNKVAEETGFDPSYIADAGEYAPGRSILSYALSNPSPHSTGRHMNAADYLWATQSRIITELAEKGNCVIVGRCADYILRDRKDCLNVFIHADDAYRAKRIVDLYGVRDKSPQKRLEEKDAKRSVNYKYFTGREWGKTENYHIALDSSVLGSETCVKIITEIAKETES
ncbi:MAG: cytidylate kinase-like family protein [Ruminococcaceae bacterium]|nr:cytidylate kinase-like family protein [Oscillospiraceae bacterium]